MIRRQLIDALPADTRMEVRSSITFLYESGVLAQQIEEHRQAIIAGSDDEDVEGLAKRILEYRRKCLPLQELIRLAQQIEKE